MGQECTRKGSVCRKFRNIQENILISFRKKAHQSRKFKPNKINAYYVSNASEPYVLILFLLEYVEIYFFSVSTSNSLQYFIIKTIYLFSGFPTIKVAGKFVKHATDNLHRPVTFRSKHTFIGLPMLRAYSSIHIDFMFKTREANGLIMFNGGKKEDFVAVELVDGHINYIVNVGDGTVTLRDTVR